MARGRMINQTIDFDPEFNALSAEAQLMYLRALAFLDRDGLITGHPHALIGKIAPLMPELVQHTSGVIQEWVRQGLVIHYATKSGDVLFFKGFGKNQSGMHYDRETPSRFPPPPGWIHGPKGLVIIDSGLTPDEVPQESGLSPAQIEVKDQDQEQQGDEEDTHAPDGHPDPVGLAWQESYGEEVPDNLAIRLANLLAECGADAVAYAIHTSKDNGAHNFRYIAQCARNYLPAATNGATSSYHVELPGVYHLQPPEPIALSVPAPPMPHDDPWAIALAELGPTLPGVAQSYLTGSRMELAGDVAGIPLYRIVVEERAALGVGWLTAQAAPAIRRKLGSLLRQQVVVEIVAAETEPTNDRH